MRVLAICGSLRAASSNKALLAAAAALAPEGVRVALHDGIRDLPHFDPDADALPAPPAVGRWRAALQGADALLLSSPEYAHGVPGALKNALDWIVSSGELDAKPIALINTSRSQFVEPQLREILGVMGARVVPQASITLHLWTNRVDEAAILANAEARAALRAALEALVAATRLRAESA